MTASRRLVTLPLVLIGLAALWATLALIPWVVQAQSQEVTATAASTGTNPPAKPTSLQASAVHDSVTLTWTASTDQTVTHYAILRRNPDVDASQVFHVIESNAGPETSYDDGSVSASSTYIYRAKAVSSTGVSQWSGYVKAETPAAPPPPSTPTPEPVSTPAPEDLRPTGLTVSLVANKVTLSWTAPAEDAASVTGYQVLRRRPDEGESAFQTLVADTMSTSTTYVDATADEEGVRYEYQVQALRGVTASAVSNTAELTLPFNICDRTQEVEDALLAAVTSTVCTVVPGSQLAAITSHDLSSKSISSLLADDFVGLTGLTTLDLEDNALTTLPAGVFNPLTSLTTLDLRNNTGLSYSPYLLSILTSLVTLDGETYTRPAVAAAPTNLTGTFVGGDIELNWTAPGTGVPTGYQILRKAGSGEEEVYVEDTYDPDADPPPTTHLDTGVTEGETYEYRVRALNAGGASVESDSATVLAALVLSGPSGVSHPEESAFLVATFTAGPPRPSLVWSLTGDDSADFSIAGGVLRFAASPPMADYESPADAD